MNELSSATKLLFTVACALVIASAFSSARGLTFKMARDAIAAQEQDQMSWGKFSRQLWHRSNLK